MQLLVVEQTRPEQMCSMHWFVVSILLCSQCFFIAKAFHSNLFCGHIPLVMNEVKEVQWRLSKRNDLAVERNEEYTYMKRIIRRLKPRRKTYSQLNPQTIKINGPFFQGWLLRTIDHKNNTSFIFIVGSFSLSKCSSYNQHYIFCGINNNNDNYHFESLVDPSQVIITANNNTNNQRLSMSWCADHIGRFDFSDISCSGNFQIGNLSFQFNATNHIPWDPSNLNYGPEGWLRKTSLLPCHYDILSVGSLCKYKICISEGLQVEGSGYSHIEGNYGDFFPSGWVWSEAIGPNNDASFSLVGGNFKIGAISPMNFIIYYRTNNLKFIYRSTDLHKFQYSIDGIDGFVSIVATKRVSLVVRHQLKLTVKAKGNINDNTTFGPAVYIPTPLGFMNSPGCRETYTGVAELECYEYTVGNYRNKKLIASSNFDLTALEFGGSFINKKI